MKQTRELTEENIVQVWMDVCVLPYAVCAYTGKQQTVAVSRMNPLGPGETLMSQKSQSPRLMESEPERES